MSKKSASKSIEIKISTVVAISAILQQTDAAQLDAAMHEMTGGETDFFEDDLAVLDIGGIDADAAAIDWNALTALFKKYRLHVVAVRNAPAGMEATILSHGLALDRNARPKAAPISAPQPAPQPSSPMHGASSATMIVDTPVRAGQRIYARGGDLIITAAVNNGAEVIADGSIHIYAPLRGRALAGASGNADARIFATVMGAELVSIAGIYRTFDNGYPDNTAERAVQMRLIGDRLDVHCLNS